MSPSYGTALKIIIGQQVALRPRKSIVVDEIETEVSTEVEEGKVVMRMHRGRERSHELVKAAKAVFLTKHGRLFCEVCRFDFGAVYGEPNFIEAHHVIPFKALRQAKTTKVSDLAMVCANCHRMLHRGNPWPTIDELRKRMMRIRRRKRPQST